MDYLNVEDAIETKSGVRNWILFCTERYQVAIDSITLSSGF